MLDSYKMREWGSQLESISVYKRYSGSARGDTNNTRGNIWLGGGIGRHKGLKIPRP